MPLKLSASLHIILRNISAYIIVELSLQALSRTWLFLMTWIPSRSNRFIKMVIWLRKTANYLLRCQPRRLLVSLIPCALATYASQIYVYLGTLGLSKL